MLYLVYVLLKIGYILFMYKTLKITTLTLLVLDYFCQIIHIMTDSGLSSNDYSK